MMRRRWGMKLVAGLFFGVVLIAGVSAAVLALWNGLMPAIFGLPVITFRQALGLLALSWLLFGRFRGPGRRGGPWRHGMRARWATMTPEEREQFSKGLRSRCGEAPTVAP